MAKSRGKKDSSGSDHYRSLVEIGIALSSEKDLGKILDLILESALATTHADAASIYLPESLTSPSGDQANHRVLRFHRSANRSTGKTIQNKLLALDHKSIAGYVASTGETVRLDDCYYIPENVPYKFNSKVDHELGYRTKSMLTVPMKTSSGKVRGVLQMINKLKPEVALHEHEIKSHQVDDIISFLDDDIELMQAFASQACVALENAKLNEEISNLFESFIRASVTAIEARDPTTSGHSNRVALLTVDFAQAVHVCSTGVFKSVHFNEDQLRELRYAALLHDFGKIGVRESVLGKEKKLFPEEMETIMVRLESARVRQEMLAWKEMALELADLAESGKLENPRQHLSKVAVRVEQFAKQLQKIRLKIMNANEPQILARDFNIHELMNWITRTSKDLGQELLTDTELAKLSIPKGTLDEAERREINSHVSHTYSFLKQIAWTENLSQVANIAHAHHEKCDGSGYPLGLKANQIPIQSKMMTIADIYDALTAMDRPYKKAASHERALDILDSEARAGQLDRELFKIFVEAEIYRVVRSEEAAKRAA